MKRRKPIDCKEIVITNWDKTKIKLTTKFDEKTKQYLISVEPKEIKSKRGKK